MFGWLRRNNDELTRLREENMALKASAADIIADAVSMPGGMESGRAKLGQHREQLAHFKGWQYVAIRAIATRIASREVFVGKLPDRQGGMMRKSKSMDDVAPLDGHPILDAIDDPNEVMVRWQLLFVTVASLELTGRAFWWLKPQRNGKLQIWPIQSDWVTPEHDSKLYAKWRVRAPGNSEGFIVPGDEMCYFSLPDPGDPIFGAVSPLATQAAAINSDEAIQKSQEIAFARGIHPSAVIRVGNLPGAPGMNGPMRPHLTPEQRKQLVEAIKGSYSGFHKHGDPFIVDGLIESIEEYGNKPAEMDWLNSGSQTKSRIMQAFGVNPLIVGEIQGANRAQAVVAEESFCNNVVNPLLTLMGQVLTAWLAPHFGERLLVWFDPCVAKDDDLHFKQWQLAAMKGFVTANEYRRNVLNLPDLPDGTGDETPGSQAAAPVVRSLAAMIDPYRFKRLVDGAHTKV